MKRMDTTSKAFIVAGVLLFVFTLVSPGKAQSATPCPEWNLATNFRVFPDEENPNRDSCGNLDVWHFLESDPNTFPAHIPSTYTLLPGFDDDFSSFGTPILGLEEWQGSAVLPLVGINNTGLTQSIGGSGGFIVWPPGVMLVHPLNNEFAIVGWRSPFNGTVTVTGGVNDLHDTCGNGILWFIDRFDGFTNTMLASGSIPNGGSQDFQDGVGGASLASVIVNQGDFLYFLVDPNSMNHFCDSTGLTVIIRPDVVIPPSASFGANPVIGTGTQIKVGVSVGDNAQIGSNVILNKNVTAGNNLVVGNGTTINQGVILGDNVTIGAGVVINRGVVIGSGVTIGNGTSIGQNTMIRDNVTIGAGVSIGKNVTVLLGAVIPDGTTVPAGAIVP